MAYAAVISALQKMDRLRHSFLPIYHHRIHRFPSSSSLFQLLSRDLQALESTYAELSCLESFLRQHTSEMKGTNMRFDPLEQRIQDAADQIEDLLESRLASESGTFPEESEAEGFSYQLLQLQHQISSCTASLMKNKEPDHQSGTARQDIPLTRIYDFGRETEFVGLDAEEKELLNWAVRGSSNLQIKSVFGMVGIGKTTLVRRIYQHESVRHDFDLFFWVTLGPNYNLEEFRRQFLDNVAQQKDIIHERLENDDINYYIRKVLMTKKYLLVLDDVWSTEAWDDLKLLFPNKGNRSRIILTTRLKDVAL